MGNTMSKKLVVCVRSVEKAEYHIKESDLTPKNDEEKAMTKEDLEIIKKFQKVIAKHGWKPMKTNNVGGAWFGGRSHSALADYIPKDKNLEDIDFLVMGWSDE